jgi:glycosyltransferase involved in cell wall biosynthesis
MSRPRLAFVYHRVAPETLGGAERYYQTLCRALAVETDVTYLTRRYWEGAREQVRDGVRLVSVDAARGGADRGRGRLWPKLSFAAGVAWHLLRHGDRYDVVHVCCFPHAGVLGVWAALLPHRGTRVVVDWHEVLPRATWRRRLGRFGQLGFAVQWLALRVGDAAVTFSRLHARRLEEEGCTAPIHVLPEFHPAVVPPPWPSGVEREPLVLFAGRLAPEKRPEIIPRVVAALRRRDPAWRGLIFGDGVQANAVRAAIAECDVRDAVEMSGFAPWEEVSAAMLRARALVSPTTREGFGLVVLEAAAHGLPSVLVAEPDNAAVELIDEGRNGSVVADADPETQAAAVLALAAEPGIHDATRAWFEEASQRFSVPESVAAHQRLHDALTVRIAPPLVGDGVSPGAGRRA